MKISVVIPNFNGKKLLEENIPKVIAACKEYEVIVVDDASTDGSIEMLAKKFPTVEFLRRPHNEGFSTTVNDGVNLAKGELIFLINSDAYPETFDQTSIEPYFKDPATFAVGLLQKSLEDGQIILRGRGIGSFRRGFLVHARGEINNGSTFWVSGGAGVFRKSIWEKLGGLYPLYNPFYWEDIDLSYRAQKAGFKIYFDAKNSVVHSQKGGSIRSQYSVKLVNETSYRNQFLFVWLNISDPFYLLQHILWLKYQLLRAFFRVDWAFLKGFLSALKLIPTVIKYRSKNRKFWMLSDRDLTITA